MATISLKKRLNHMSGGQDVKELRVLLEAARADIVALATALDTLAAKLNADGGVTDTNYATGNAAAVTLGA